MTIYHHQPMVYGWAARVDSTWCYNPDYPLEIQVIIGERCEPWTFSRDLLAEGLTMGAGDGAVTFALTKYSPGLRMVLSEYGLTATFHVDRESLIDFLGQTMRLVPMGAEKVDAAVDEFLAGVLP